MASIRKIASGWQAQVARKGVRTSRTFPSKREAQDWAARQEHLILAGEGRYGGGIFADLILRYKRDESPKKRGERWEAIRLAKIAKDPIAARPVRSLQAADFAAWRDKRMGEVKANTVRREMQLMRGVLRVAVREWGVLPANPMDGVTIPKKPAPRNKLVTDAEIAALVVAAGEDLRLIKARAVHAFRFSCLTAMRAGEVCALRPGDVKGRVATLHTSKTGKGREVPLSLAALELWDALPGPGFDITPRQLDANFRAVKKAAKITGLTYHDSRHRAITDLAKKVHVLSLAKIVGHDNVAQLMTYYEERADSIALLLD